MSALVAPGAAHPKQLPYRAVVEAFLFHEAWLADAHAYDEWLELWDEDLLYWVPCNDDDADPETHVALIYDRRSGLEDRIAKLKGGHAFAQQPRSRLSRTVSNVAVRAGPDGLVEARSVSTITAFRLGRLDIFSGHVLHRLRPVGDSFRIALKKVDLVNNDGVISNLTFLV